MIILYTIILSSIIAVGFYVACGFDGDENYDLAPKEIKLMWSVPDDHQKMILWWVRYYGGRIIPHFWTKPIYSCLPCMGSLHSVLPVIVLMPDQLYLWPLVALGTVGVNYLITLWWK